MKNALFEAMALALVAVALPVRAQDAGAPAPPAVAGGQVDGGSEPSLLDEIDAAASDATPGRAAPAVAPAPTARAFQSFNPDISVIIDGTAGYANKASYSLAGDDPDLKGGSSARPAGFTVQELEIAFQAVVDPFFRADVFVTIPNLEGVEVEEAVVTTTSLPAGFQVRAGIFRSAFGRQNGQHLHLQDFTRRPLINEAFLGVDGLRSPGLQISWLFPTSFFLQLSAEAFSVARPDETGHLTSFGGGERTNLTYTTELKVFVPVTPSLSLYGGLNAAFGKSTYPRDGASTSLEGVDLYLKYKPPNVVSGYFSLAWTTEYFLRQVQPLTPEESVAQDGGLYTQLVFQVARQWYLGVRQDFLGIPQSTLQSRVQRTSLSFTFATSEFARIRLYGERETTPAAGQSIFSGPECYAAYLQLEVAIGAHGAHPF
ncbi:MAG TPA: hypothetical protein VMT11_07070 [Myxococcaceae bacterium]|nr:hypothetical protein [Myxococcaceae bacterium]